MNKNNRIKIFLLLILSMAMFISQIKAEDSNLIDIIVHLDFADKGCPKTPRIYNITELVEDGDLLSDVMRKAKRMSKSELNSYKVEFEKVKKSAIFKGDMKGVYYVRDYGRCFNDSIITPSILQDDISNGILHVYVKPCNGKCLKNNSGDKPNPDDNDDNNKPNPDDNDNNKPNPDDNNNKPNPDEETTEPEIIDPNEDHSDKDNNNNNKGTEWDTNEIIITDNNDTGKNYNTSTKNDKDINKSGKNLSDTENTGIVLGLRDNNGGDNSSSGSSMDNKVDNNTIGNNGINWNDTKDGKDNISGIIEDNGVDGNENGNKSTGKLDKNKNTKNPSSPQMGDILWPMYLSCLALLAGFILLFAFNKKAGRKEDGLNYE